VGKSWGILQNCESTGFAGGNILGGTIYGDLASCKKEHRWVAVWAQQLEREVIHQQQAEQER
jgi:hypothetical protein